MPNVETQLNFPSTIIDTTSGWDNTRDVWTCPRHNYWYINALVEMSEMSMPGGNEDFYFRLALWTNGGTLENTVAFINSRNLETGYGSATISLSTIVPLTFGDEIAVAISQTATNNLSLSYDHQHLRIASLGAGS